MTEAIIAGSDWWRDKVLSAHEKLAAQAAQIESLARADGQHREDIHKLRDEMAALRAEVAELAVKMGRGFHDVSNELALHLGQMRVEMQALKVTAPERNAPIPAWAIRVGVIMVLLFIVALGAAAFGIGAAYGPTRAALAAAGIAAQ